MSAFLHLHGHGSLTTETNQDGIPSTHHGLIQAVLLNLSCCNNGSLTVVLKMIARVRNDKERWAVKCGVLEEIMIMILLEQENRHSQA